MKFLQWHAMRELLGGQGVVQGLRPFPSRLCISKPKHATEVLLQSIRHALKVGSKLGNFRCTQIQDVHVGL